MEEDQAEAHRAAVRAAVNLRARAYPAAARLGGHHRGGHHPGGASPPEDPSAVRAGRRVRPWA
jgi:hypothetical protein